MGCMILTKLFGRKENWKAHDIEVILTIVESIFFNAYIEACIAQCQIHLRACKLLVVCVDLKGQQSHLDKLFQHCAASVIGNFCYHLVY